MEDEKGEKLLLAERELETCPFPAEKFERKGRKALGEPKAGEGGGGGSFEF